MTKENCLVELLKTIVPYFCNKKHLLSCQIYLNELRSWRWPNQSICDLAWSGSRWLHDPSATLVLTSNYVTSLSFLSYNLSLGEVIIRIISLYVYLWYQVDFVIIIGGFLVTIISINTHLNNIISGWTFTLS